MNNILVLSFGLNSLLLSTSLAAKIIDQMQTNLGLSFTYAIGGDNGQKLSQTTTINPNAWAPLAETEVTFDLRFMLVMKTPQLAF